MSVAAAAVSVLLAALLSFSAARKLTHEERYIRGYVRVGVPEDKLNYLAYILLAGAGGLGLGIFWPPIGVAAAIGVVTYFLLAIASHVRADDEENLPVPVVVELIAVAALVLRLWTL